SEVRYSLLDWRQRYWFTVQPHTGVVALVSPLDRETTSHLTVPLEARTSQGSAEATLYVTVEDVNEFPPRFANDVYQTQITEEDDRHLPKPVIQVVARDRDGGSWGVLRYSLSGDGVSQAQDPHPQDPNPNLHNDNLNNEATRRQYFPQSRSSSLSTPHQPELTPIAKSSLRLLPVSSSLVSDIVLGLAGPALRSPGAPPPAVAPPSVSKSKHWTRRRAAFSIDPESGTIYVLKPLDRDAPTGHARWRLTVTATDGQYTASTDVLVNLKDVNDNAPVFPHDVVDANVLENSMSGTTVAVVTAHDADDPHEGDNARLSYSLLKNVIDERSRLPMFTVDRQTGALRTAVCCLDREHTSSYGLVIAATDGGGLQGTCTVTVNIDDVNDVPPSFVRSHVDVLVPEHRQPSFQRSSSHGASPSNGAPSSSDVSSDGVTSSKEVTLPKEELSSSAMLSSNREFPSRGLPSSKSRSNVSENFISTLAVTDPDTSNVFAYRVVPGSGHGWQLVEVAASTAGADLFSRVPLDFENPQHRAGLNFRVQVTDQGDMPWSSHPRVSECSVTVTVQVFAGHGNDRWFAGHGNDSSLVTVNVDDVNDNPPFLLGGSRVQLPPMAGGSDGGGLGLPAGSRVPFTLTLDDPDDWPQGHGPPFHLDPHLTADAGYRVSFYPGRASAGGGVVVAAELLTLRPLSAAVSVPLTLSDAGSPPMRRQMTLTLVPHSAESAHRNVSLVKIATVVSAHAAPPAPLGRLPRLPFPGDATQRHGTDTETDNVSSLFRDKFRFNFYEPDPVTGKSLGNSSRGLDKFSARITWQGANSGIRLDSDSGSLLLDPAAGLGRHEAKLLLSSASGEAHELTVYADVSSVGVADALKSTPIDLAILPHELLTNADAEEPNSESPLDRLLRLLNQHLADYSELSRADSPKSHDMSAHRPHVMVVAVETIRRNHDSHTRVWLLQQPPERHLRFALEPLIFQHQHKIEAEVGAAVLGAGVSTLGDCASRRVACRCCCRDRAALDQRWHLADAGARSHAGPSLRIESLCRCPVQDGAEEERGQLASLTSAHAVTAGLEICECGPDICGCGPEICGCGPEICGCGPEICGCSPEICGCCLSAVRVFGHLLPLPEIVNNNHSSNNSNKNTSNSAGSVTSFANVISGCTSPSVCTNTSCPPPLTCGHSWGLNTCGCAAGEELSRDGTACLDVDECRYDPCLNLGVCVNTHPGYRCVCGPAHRGEHCEWGAAGALEAPYSLSILVASAVASAAALLLSMDLVNLPPPTGGSIDMEDPDILLPPPPLHFNPSSTTFGFDGGGLNFRAGSLQ
ncbi:uncharacterized protein LOC108668249, partial [Hyalella azteca]|uniref:Uncharacterized protein LOC108668249 n=1 Tax=Hyalella azteca TaxID=294128 RepID=A0A979FMB6_HYAAZ